MRGEQKILIICVAFVLWYAFRRHNINDYVNDIEEEQTPECKGKLEVSMGDNYEEISFAKRKNIINYPYGSFLKWNCIGNVDKLNMKMNGKILDTYIRGNFIFSSYLRLLEHTELICTDTESKCTVTVIVKLIPTMGVVSRNKLVEYKGTQVLQYGDDTIGVVCMGPDSSWLVLRKDGMRLRTERHSNKPTADIQTAYFEPPELRVTEYVCTDENTGLSETLNVRVIPKMYVHSQGNLIEPLHSFGGHQMEVYSVSKGDSIEVFCTWPLAVKIFGIGNDKELISESVGLFSNTMRIKKIITEESKFGCADIESDYIRHVRIDVPIEYTTKTEQNRGDEL